MAFFFTAKLVLRTQSLHVPSAIPQGECAQITNHHQLKESLLLHTYALQKKDWQLMTNEQGNTGHACPAAYPCHNKQSTLGNIGVFNQSHPYSRHHQAHAQR